ncbi:exosortase K [Bernardetia sp. Wsw4-3y2]|uniref:exosortase K n=1 Tax=Bernardetia sp. Wsw4-3y2 TaxID=3127471 RepID=UPI0030D12E8F
MKKLRLTFLFTVFCIGFAFKWYFTNLDVEYSVWLLKPTTIWVEQITGLNFDFLQNEGYVCTHTLPITIIDKSCSGLNFWLMALLLGTFLLYKKVTNLWQFFYSFMAVFGLAWLVTIIANTGRIVISIKFLPLLIPYIDYSQSHLLLGIFIYITMLILYYLGLKWAIGVKNKYK